MQVLMRRPWVTMRAAYCRPGLPATGNIPILARDRNTGGRPFGERAHRQGVAERVGTDAAATRRYAQEGTKPHGRTTQHNTYRHLRVPGRSEEHTSELQSQSNLVCR